MSSGYMRRRGSGWALTVSAGFDPVTGKRQQHYRTVAGSKREAERALATFVAEVDAGKVGKAGKLTLGDYLTEQWLPHVRTRVRPRTAERYESLMRTHVVPALGALLLAKLRPVHVQQLEARLLGERDGRRRLSARTVLHVHRVLGSALRHAVRMGLIAVNPIDAVQPPRPERPTLAIVGPEEARAIMDAAEGTDLALVVRLALATGMRRGELLALRWADVDLERGTARVVRTLQHARGELRFEEPKTERSRRTVSLPGFAVAALRQHRASQAERRLLAGEAWQDHGLVLDRGDGGPMLPETVSHGFARLAARTGLGPVRFHDLRHAHATLMLVSGVHPKVVSERLGHSGVAITLDTYSHVVPALQAEAAAVMDGLLGVQTS